MKTNVTFSETELRFLRLGLEVLQKSGAVVLNNSENVACHIYVNGLIDKIMHQEEVQNPVIEH